MFHHFEKLSFADRFIYIFLFCLIIFLISVANTFSKQNFPENKTESKNISGDTIMQKITFRPEHIAFNVENPVAVAQWFVDNMGFKIMYKGDPPGNTRFVSDEKNNMMMELYNNQKFPKLNLPNVSYMSIHFAFMADSIEQVKEKLLAAGATIAEDITLTPSGDKVLMLRTPWGMPIQFVERAKPMLKYSFLRPEHFAINLPDPVAVSNWLVENMGMQIIRQGPAPAYSTFIADENKKMMFELYNNTNYPALDFAEVSYMSIHFAFTADDLEAVKTKLLAAGATIAEDLNTSSNGTQVLVLRGPEGLPLQFIKRPVPMIK